MGSYLKGILIFFFFYLFVGPVITDLLTDLAVIIGAGNGIWIGMLGALIGALLGLFLAVRRVKMNIPWKMTPLKIALMIGCFHFTLQKLWLILVFALGETFHGSNPRESTSSTHMLTAMDDIIRFPSLFLQQEHWTSFLSSTFWVIVSYCVFVLINRMRAIKSRTAANNQKHDAPFVDRRS